MQTSGTSLNQLGFKRRRSGTDDVGAVTKRPRFLSRTSVTIPRPITRKQVKRMIEKKEEIKHFPIFTSGGVDSAGDLTNLTSIAQGVGASVRVGEELFLKSVIMSYEIIGADATNYLRVIVFQWHDASTPAIADVLQPGSGNPWIAPYNPSRTNSYTVLWDKAFSTTVNGPNSANGRVHLRTMRRKIEFAGTSTSAASGQLYLIRISDSLAVANPSFAMNGLVLFTDS